MKNLFTLTFFIAIILAGCQVESQQSSRAQSDSDDKEVKVTIEPSLQPEIALDELSSTAEAFVPNRVSDKEVPDDANANADVLYVKAYTSGDGTWTFAVTVEHLDTGWEDYADGWDVVLPDGKVLNPDPESPFTRLLLHPHENEQPFTRSQSGIIIPEGTGYVIVRAHDLVDGFGGKEVKVDLTTAGGASFEVNR